MEWLHNTVLGRVVLLAVFVLSLQLPIHWIHELVGEREANRHAAVAEVQASAGGAQMASGPVLLVPYLRSQLGFFDPSRPATKRNYAILRPQTLDVRGTMSPLVRTRGIFDVLLYRASLHFDAVFARPNPADLGLADEQIIWEEEVVALSSDDIPASITVAGASVTLESGQVEPYVVAPVPVRDSLSVAYDLEISGSQTSFLGARQRDVARARLRMAASEVRRHPSSRESGRASGRIHGDVEFGAAIEAAPRDHRWLCRER